MPACVNVSRGYRSRRIDRDILNVLPSRSAHSSLSCLLPSLPSTSSLSAIVYRRVCAAAAHTLSQSSLILPGNSIRSSSSSFARTRERLLHHLTHFLSLSIARERITSSLYPSSLDSLATRVLTCCSGGPLSPSCILLSIAAEGEQASRLSMVQSRVARILIRGADWVTRESRESQHIPHTHTHTQGCS